MIEMQADPRSRRFVQAAMPLLDDVYRLARFLLRNPADAEDAVQECYLRALRHFDSYRGPAMKPWLFSILRNLCYTQFAQRAKRETPTDFAEFESKGFDPLWQETQFTPEVDVLRHQQAAAIRKIIEALPQTLREVIILREMDGLSYRDIANVTGVPVGTVMSRLARGRTTLRVNLNAAGLAPRSAMTEAPAFRVPEMI